MTNVVRGCCALRRRKIHAGCFRRRRGISRRSWCRRRWLRAPSADPSSQSATANALHWPSANRQPTLSWLPGCLSWDDLQTRLKLIATAPGAARAVRWRRRGRRDGGGRAVVGRCVGWCSVFQSTTETMMPSRRRASRLPSINNAIELTDADRRSGSRDRTEDARCPPRLTVPPSRDVTRHAAHTTTHNSDLRPRDDCWGSTTRALTKYARVRAPRPSLPFSLCNRCLYLMQPCHC